MMTVHTTVKMDDENIEKFIKLYGEGNGDFSLSLVIPPPNEDAYNDVQWCRKNWDTKIDASDYGNGIELRDVLCGESDFETADKPPIKVFEKMAADGLELEFFWEAEDLADWGIGKGKAANGKLWYCIDFDETSERYEEDTGEYWDPRESVFSVHTDEYGNTCEIDSCTTLVNGNNELTIIPLPIKKILDTKSSEGSDWDYAFKIPRYFEGIYEDEDIEIDEFSDNLQCRSITGGSVYLLNKKGKRIKSLLDFDHSEPDDEGNIYYPALDSDLKNPNEYHDPVFLTKEAEDKWRKLLKIK